MHGADKPDENCPLAKMMKSKKHEDAELYIEEKKIWAQVSADPQYDKKGDLVSIVHRVNDITESRQVAKALQESETRYRELFENASLAIFKSTLERKLLNVNPAFAHMFGYQSPEEAIATVKDTATDLFAYPHQREEIARLKTANPDLNTFEVLFRRKDGGTFWGKLTLRMLTDSDGASFFEGFIEDITERKRVEQALKTSEAHYRLLADHTNDMVWLMDMNLKTTYLSPSTEKVSGFTVHERMELTMEQSLTPESLKLASDLFLNELPRVEAEPDYNPTHTLELEYFRKDGTTIWTEDKFSVIRDENGKPAFILAEARDISARKQSEETLKRAFADLQRTSAELERFTCAVSHDLKSPLVTIKTFLGYLKQDLPDFDTGKIEKDMLYMQGAADKMGRLLDELLELSRIGRLVNPPVAVTFPDLVQEALNMVAGSIAERNVQVRVSDEAITLNGDRPRLVDIWQNLLENAVKLMGDQASPHIEIGVERRGADIVFFVCDNGMGIDSRCQSRIFNLFDKIDVKSEGTGLGLAIVKRIVELYKGTIWFESAGAGLGTCFLFTLPAAVKEKNTM
jgi:PAS domain S-box-containing protein